MAPPVEGRGTCRPPAAVRAVSRVPPWQTPTAAGPPPSGTCWSARRRSAPGHGQGPDHPGPGAVGPLARRAHVGGLRARGHHPRAGGRRRRGAAPRPPHHDRHRRPPGHPGLLLPPGHRRLPDGRRRLRRVPGQPRRPHQPRRRRVAGRRLHADRRRLHRGRRRRRSSRPSPRWTAATVPLCLGILLFITLLNLRGLGETARAFLLPDHGVHRRAAGHHRRRPHPPPRPQRATAGHVAAARRRVSRR